MDHMKSPLEAPEKQIAEETSAKPEKRAAAAVIDTSKMSKGKREALELAEASRDPLDGTGWKPVLRDMKSPIQLPFSSCRAKSRHPVA